MGKLTEKEMRLLACIVLDRAGEARKTEAKEDSKEMEVCCEIISLSNKLVKIVNEMYPVIDNKKESIFGIEE